MVCDIYYLDCRIQIRDYGMLANLIVLDMHDFDLILGMDWLSIHHASMYYLRKTISFRMDEPSPSLLFEGTKRSNNTLMISEFKSKKLIQSGCERYIAFITKNK